MININLQLEIIPGNKIKVPGAETVSIQTSLKLSNSLARQGINYILIDLKTALKAIPGSYVKHGNNFNQNFRKAWFVLPPKKPDCPCSDYLDYYKILRELPYEEDGLKESYNKCDTIGMGWCGSEFDETPPPKSPYIQDGLPLDKKVLPIIPSWLK
jgi:hypothetical protein